MDALRHDPKLARLIEEHGDLSLTPAENFFERFVVSIVRQQLSMESARATRNRLFDRVSVTPAGIQEADEAALQAAGLSAAKADYVKNLATAFTDRGWSRAYFADMDDEAVIEELTEVRGVGTWTAKMVLMFCLAREDVFPVEDLGIRAAMTDLYGLEDRAAMVEKATEWRPHRSYASLYLWRATD